MNFLKSGIYSIKRNHLLDRRPHKWEEDALSIQASFDPSAMTVSAGRGLLPSAHLQKMASDYSVDLQISVWGSLTGLLILVLD